MLVFRKELLRRAVLELWQRKYGAGCPVSVITCALILATSISSEDHSWFSGAPASILGIALWTAISTYQVQYLQTMKKFRALDSPQATFLAEEASFTISSELGSTTLKWSAVQHRPTGLSVFRNAGMHGRASQECRGHLYFGFTPTSTTQRKPMSADL